MSNELQQAISNLMAALDQEFKEKDEKIENLQNEVNTLYARLYQAARILMGENIK